LEAWKSILRWRFIFVAARAEKRFLGSARNDGVMQAKKKARPRAVRINVARPYGKIRQG
jgi:hypothetical protein